MICFVIALDGEAAPVIKNMQGVQMQLIHGKKVYSGTLCGDEMRLIVCGVGKVNAAACAMLACERFKAEAIINIGTAGALRGGMNVGEIFPVSQAAEYDFDLCKINGTAIGVLNEFDERWLPLASTDGRECKKLATGDRFNGDKADYNLLTKDFGADLRDMEGAAIAHVCAHSGIPLFCYKVVSDVAGSTTEQYLKNIALCYQNTEHEICGIYGAVASKIKK